MEIRMGQPASPARWLSVRLTDVPLNGGTVVSSCQGIGVGQCKPGKFPGDVAWLIF